MPSRRVVVICLGTALATGLVAGALVGAGDGDHSLAKATSDPSPTSRQAWSYTEVQITIPSIPKAAVAEDQVGIVVPSGWEEQLRGTSGLYRDYVEPDNGDWLRVRLYPATEEAGLRPREVALGNLRELRGREEGLRGYRDLGQKNRGVETSDTPYPNKPCYQLRYSFLVEDRRRYALERFFGDGDVIYLIGGYAWSSERLERLEPVVDKVIGSLRKTEG